MTCLCLFIWIAVVGVANGFIGQVDPPPAPCGECPCVDTLCSNDTDCCDPGDGWSYGNMSFCQTNLVCRLCVAVGGSCLTNDVCRCGSALFNMSCVDFVCVVDYPDAPCGFCPCQDQPCVNNSECCDPLEWSYGNASICTDGVCVPTDPPAPCANVTDCPFDFFCDPLTYTCDTCNRGEARPLCCNTTIQCNSTEYCSLLYGSCVGCVGLGGNCSFEPALACACNISANLICVNDICVATPAPTAAPTNPGTNPWPWVLIGVGVVSVLMLGCCCLSWFVAAPACDERRKKRKNID